MIRSLSSVRFPTYRPRPNAFARPSARTILLWLRGLSPLRRGFFLRTSCIPALVFLHPHFPGARAKAPAPVSYGQGWGQRDSHLRTGEREGGEPHPPRLWSPSEPGHPPPANLHLSFKETFSAPRLVDDGSCPPARRLASDVAGDDVVHASASRQPISGRRCRAGGIDRKPEIARFALSGPCDEAEALGPK